MANGQDGSAGIPWYSWLILTFHLVWSGGIFWFEHSLVVPLWLAWLISGLWVAAALIMGLIDFVLSKGSQGSTDTTAIDRWTAIHFGAGIVFGIWYVPILWVVILAFFWECFEFSVAGFGDQEIIQNRLMDIAAAVVGWLIVVILIVAIAKTPFPAVSPVPSPQTGQTSSAQQAEHAKSKEPAKKEPPKPEHPGR